MTILRSKSLYYTQLAAKTWCAAATLHPPIALSLSCLWTHARPLSPSYAVHHNITLDNLCWHKCDTTKTLTARSQAVIKRQQQRVGVRLLLCQLLEHLNITDNLNEQQFPYRLTHHGHYVCFSHSQNKVAVVISQHRAVGVDIEMQDIAWSVVQRFYHHSELDVLMTMPTAQRNATAQWLWQVKESMIKVQQYTLAQGLGKPYPAVLKALINQHMNHTTPSIIFISAASGYQIALLSEHCIAVVF